ncbi:MAG: multidrug efflux SMR transporter [Candidatus Methanomethylophilaceae archaeon]|jgi:quaternary ammonium compound-resistance protein SugE|nr:multidrug efflux SMR transporter [Candidatus Methanomethylophilaceae archaeon]
MQFEWIILIVAGFLEPCWVYTLEKSDNLRNAKWALATAAILIVDLYMLSVAMIPIGAGTAYAVWVGIGAIVTLLMGIALYGESASMKRIFFILLIVSGIVGLNLTAGGA